MKTSQVPIGESEIMVIEDMKYGVQLSYTQGQTPRVIAKVQGAVLKKTLLDCESKGVPVAESPALNDKVFKELKPGYEIPADFYRAAAQAIALIYRISSHPHPVRVVKVLAPKTAKTGKAAELPGEDISGCLKVHQVAVELGAKGYERLKDELESSLHLMRQRVALELGLNLNEIALVLNPLLGEEDYRLKLREVLMDENQLPQGPDKTDLILPLVSRLKSLITANAADLLGYSQVEGLMENLRKQNPGLLKGLYPAPLSVPVMRMILRNLLKEGFSIRDLEKIVETVRDNLVHTGDPDLLTELVRAAFSVYLSRKYQDVKGYLSVLLTSPQVEEKILSFLKETESARWLELPPEDGIKILGQVEEELRKARTLGVVPVVLCSPRLRRFLKRLLEGTFPFLAVLSYSEIAPLAQVTAVGMIQG